MEKDNKPNKQDHKDNQQKSKSFFKRFLGLLQAGVFFILALFNSAIKFFFRLSFAQKLIFIILLTFVALLSYSVGFNNGYKGGKQETNNQVFTITGYKVTELDELVEQINKLKESLDILRDNSE